MQPELLHKLSTVQKEWLKKGKIENLCDLLSTSPQEWAYKWRTSVVSVNELLSILLENQPIPQTVKQPNGNSAETHSCTTGDDLLDVALAGGIRRGLIWEIVGESAAGKTQLALQLALCAQLPEEKGGFSGSTCFLTTSSVLPTTRLQQIADRHPLLHLSGCGLDHVLTQPTPSVPILLHVLQYTLPTLIENRARDSADIKSPIKLLILDALAELFHTSEKTTTNTLVERSKNISQIGFLLHSLASKYNIAILVLNEVVDSFDRDQDVVVDTREILYRQQSKWFGRPHLLPYQNKEAALGLVWANQVNTRVFLSRTGRRRHLTEEETEFKRAKAETISTEQFNRGLVSSDQLTLIRRLTVVFSSNVRPVSLDYYVSECGVSSIPGSMQYPITEGASRRSPEPKVDPSPIHQSRQRLAEGIQDKKVAGVVEEALEVGQASDRDREDDWDQYWATEALNADFYSLLEEEGEEEIIPSTEEQGVMDI